MKRAVITGFFSGIIISAVLVCAFYIRSWLPDTFTANLFFIGIFFLSIVSVLWLSLHFYCRSSEVKWMPLNITGIISIMIAVLIVRICAEPLGYAIYKFMDLAIILFLVSLSIAAVYYAINRNRPYRNSKNQELIF